MKEYPKIQDSKSFPNIHCIAFDKYDGSNLRFEWSKKKGFHKYGTRKRLFDKTDEIFGCAIDIFNNTYSSSLDKSFRDNKIFRNCQEITVFCEFFGPNSFGGLHKEKDPKELMLFDIWLYKFGLIGPKDFVKVTDENGIKRARIVWNGKFNGQFAEDVRNGKFNTKEGVVCKAGSGGNDIEMCKIKTNEYKKKLQEIFGTGWGQFWE